MNDRIKQLALEAGLLNYVDNETPRRCFIHGHADLEEVQKFAELIVRECVGLCDQAVEENKRTFYTVNETREVGPALVAKGCQVQAEKLSKQIKTHFGVE